MGARDVALRLLTRVEKDGAYVDRLLTSPQILNLSQRDRAFVREMVKGVLRWRLRLDRIIGLYYDKDSLKLDPVVRNVLRLGLFQIMFMNSVPDHAAVNESVNSAAKRHGKGAGGLVNALLRRFLREGEPGEWPSDPAERCSFELSHPLWIARRWLSAFGFDSAVSIMKAGIGKHTVFIRPGRCGIETGSLAESLASEGIETAVIPEMPGCLEVSGAGGLFDTASFGEGLFFVQDPSAGMASLLLSPVRGENVLDLCAAPGGKTMHCASLMEDDGHITAVDLHETRLGLVKETAERLGYKSISFEAGDILTFGKSSGKRFDRVLLDVPCSGTGVFVKRPDMKWRVTEDDVSRLAALQYDMLDNAAELVVSCGVLVYSTCTLEHEENEDTVRKFLENNPEFSVERDERFAAFEHVCGYLILPHEMRGTGAFAVKLRRT